MTTPEQASNGYNDIPKLVAQYAGASFNELGGQGSSRRIISLKGKAV